MRFIIGDPPNYYKEQLNNKIHPWKTCFPTSMAMPIQYILNRDGMGQTDIGIPADMQIEDFITKYMIDHFRDWRYADPEEKLFDSLMKDYDATFRNPISYDSVCESLALNEIPGVVFGEFGKFHPSVKGHVGCAVGFDTEKRILIVNDPYMDIVGKRESGIAAEYPWDEIYARDKDLNGWFLEIKRKS